RVDGVRACVLSEAVAVGEAQVNDPRFIVRESSGYSMNGTTNARQARLVTEVLVLDRAYCHKVVWSSLTTVMSERRYYFTTGGRHRPNRRWRAKARTLTARAWPLERRRRYAAELAERLNAEDAAVV